MTLPLDDEVVATAKLLPGEATTDSVVAWTATTSLSFCRAVVVELEIKEGVDVSMNHYDIHFIYNCPDLIRVPTQTSINEELSRIQLMDCLVIVANIFHPSVRTGMSLMGLDEFDELEVAIDGGLKSFWRDFESLTL
nr:hypothetical protein Iba_chr03cCG5600 [Ipomoea batatas]